MNRFATILGLLIAVSATPACVVEDDDEVLDDAIDEAFADDRDEPEAETDAYGELTLCPLEYIGLIDTGKDKYGTYQCHLYTHTCGGPGLSTSTCTWCTYTTGPRVHMDKSNNCPAF